MLMPQKKPERHLRKGALITWILIVGVLLVFYALYQEWFDVGQLRDLVSQRHVLVAIIYVLILSFLGLTLIPSTPFAIAGVLLFHPVEAYILNLIGILTSSTIVYYFARFLGLADYFKAKYPKKMAKLSKALDKKELPIIIGWSFFPAVPTDLIIYVSSTLKIHLWKALLGVLIGEGILNAFYIFFSGRLI